MITNFDKEQGKLLEQDLKKILSKKPQGYRLTREEIESTYARVGCKRIQIPHFLMPFDEEVRGITATDFIRWTRLRGFSLINIAEDFALRLKQVSDEEAKEKIAQ